MHITIYRFPTGTAVSREQGDYSLQYKMALFISVGLAAFIPVTIDNVSNILYFIRKNKNNYKVTYARKQVGSCFEIRYVV
jgi:hypothetical protein